MNDELMGEETGKWIVLNYFPFNPVDVYGFFDSEEEARAYADKNRMAENGNSYEVKQVMNAHYVEMPDPVRDGWVGSDGRP